MIRTRFRTFILQTLAPVVAVLSLGICASVVYAQGDPGKPAAKAPTAKAPASKPASKSPQKPSSIPADNAIKSGGQMLQILGIRPGINLDSVEKVMKEAGVKVHEVREDTLSRSYFDKSLKIYVVDSIICRLTWMRFAFIFDANTHRLRRLTVTPRESSVIQGRDDDVLDVLLLYFNQLWGTPALMFEQPPAYFRWKTGNIEVRGYIKRGYPFWVMEG